MKYRHVTEQADYSPYASGMVFHSIGGHPPLPVRLSSEVFLRAYEAWGKDAPCTIYDPMCGSGATLAALTLLHGPMIGAVVGSDVSADALRVAALNFGMLSEAGMRARIAKLEADIAAYGKDSHREALAAARSLLGRVEGSVSTSVFQADATSAEQLRAGLGDVRVDIVMLDIPYGDVAEWGGAAQMGESEAATTRVMAALRSVIAPEAVVALFMPKRHGADVAGYQRIQRIKAGKREVWLLRVRD